MSDVEFQTEAPEKRNSWKAAPTWLNVLWFINIALFPCGLITFFLPGPVPHTQIGRDVATPEVRMAILIGLLIGFAATVWIWFRLRSESGPAAKGAPWGVVAFVLFGWAFGAESLLSAIVNLFAYPPIWRVWTLGGILLALVAMVGAHCLETRRSIGIPLTAAYWSGSTVVAFLRLLSLPDNEPFRFVFVGLFSLVPTLILLYCLWRSAVREWANR